MSEWFAALREKTIRYGAGLNSHDAVKFLALVIMTIDHIGAYLESDALWWRAVGRITFPVWFFLAGYTRLPKVPPVLLATGIFLALLSSLTFHPFFPLNALISIAICRWCVAAVIERDWLERYPAEIAAACLLAYPFTAPLFEYGALGIAYAMFGAMIRHDLKGTKFTGFTVFCLWYFLAINLVNFSFDLTQTVFVVVGTTATIIYLSDFKVLPVIAAKHAPYAVAAVRMLARLSMYYYVIHRLFLQSLQGFWLSLPQERIWHWFGSLHHAA